ncbi:MAG: UDP-N-acetylmuramoyl-L-alanine--D-glutamate ligase [Rhizobacter sp.]|nr:UDP-N-acetylmuramoyl-L-alanine--D-glutamate ligase [Rhizobacter sp.]
MKFLQDAAILVLGLGESGLAMARWCTRCGARVRVWDSRATPPNLAALAQHVPGAQLLSGALDDAALEGVQLVLRSPGLAPGDERIASPLQRAAERGVLVQGELELFVRALADLKAERGYAPKVIAITGTNGKTTTAAMAGLLIARTGQRVAVAGNIGPTMLQTLSDALALEPAAVPPAVPDANPAGMERGAAGNAGARAEAAVAPMGSDDGAADRVDPVDELPAVDEGPPDIAPPAVPQAPVFEHLPQVWVLELSSFQLDDAKGFEPDAAAVLNISQDHLDWHGSMSAYVAAKARVFGKQAVMVVNRDDALVERLVPEPIPGKGRHARPIEREVIRFGLNAPQRPGDFGVVVENDMAWLVRAREADATLRRGRAGKGVAAEDEELHIQRLMPADALRVRGRHNAANALAALALACAIDSPLAPMLHGLRDYRGEPHRVTYIATIDGVEIFDDSKGTNVGATVAALNGLGTEKAPGRLVVILGGDGKGQDFEPLREPVERHVRAVATLGRDAQRLEEALAATGVTMMRHATLEAATRWCFEQAQRGDAVLLSPACASLDMFRNYGHRAEVFVAEVRSLAAQRGGVEA